MFQVKVVGQYVARSGVMEKEKIKKNYEITGNIPSLTGALSVVKNKLLDAALSQKYEDYITYLTYHIVEITPLTESAKTDMAKAEINFMDRTSLIAYIKEHALPVKHEFYPELFKLREAVQYAKDDPKGYEAHFALRESDLRLDLEMAKCNPQLFNRGEHFNASVSLGAPTPTTTATKPIKASKAPELAKKTGNRLEGLKADQIRDGEMAALEEGEL